MKNKKEYELEIKANNVENKPAFVAKIAIKKNKYKCIKDPQGKFNEAVGKVQSPVDWKSDFLGWMDDGHSYAIRTNLRALSGEDIITFLSLTYGLEFEKAE